jgi:hypothetical protein
MTPAVDSRPPRKLDVLLEIREVTYVCCGQQTFEVDRQRAKSMVSGKESGIATAVESTTFGSFYGKSNFSALSFK